MANRARLTRINAFCFHQDFLWVDSALDRKLLGVLVELELPILGASEPLRPSFPARRTLRPAVARPRPGGLHRPMGARLSSASTPHSLVTAAARPRRTFSATATLCQA